MCQKFYAETMPKKGITINMEYYKKNKRGSLVTSLSLHDQETKMITSLRIGSIFSLLSLQTLLSS